MNEILIKLIEVSSTNPFDKDKYELHKIAEDLSYWWHTLQDAETAINAELALKQINGLWPRAYKAYEKVTNRCLVSQKLPIHSK